MLSGDQVTITFSWTRAVKELCQTIVLSLSLGECAVLTTVLRYRLKRHTILYEFPRLHRGAIP
jgi:hypothetical protein